MTEEFKKIMEIAQQVALRENCLLYDLEMTGAGKGRTLRVYIDKEGKEGVSIDDCSKVSRGLDLILDVEDLIPGGNYQLEVSSPGLDRHLSQTWHYAKAKGESVNFQLNQDLGKIDGNVHIKDQKRKKLVGSIVDSDENKVDVSFENFEKTHQTVSLPYEFIHKAKVVFSHENHFNTKKPKSGKG
jgi:ribosome maturation factor RimP